MTEKTDKKVEEPKDKVEEIEKAEEKVEEKAEEKTEEKVEEKAEEKTEEKAEEKTEEKTEGSKKRSIFVTEDDLFDVVIRYYFDDIDNLIIDGIDDVFDNNRTDIQEDTFTFKRASQGDTSLISSRMGEGPSDSEEFAWKRFLEMEFIRVLVLIRKWTLPKPLDNENVLALHPQIVKGVINGVREKIGTDGLI